MCDAGLRSFAISETQKYGHVTYFWNGNRSGYIDPDLETYIEIPSDNVEFNKTPAMKAREITDRTIELLRSARVNLIGLVANRSQASHPVYMSAKYR